MVGAIENSWLGEFMRAHAWAFPACEALHFIGLSMLIGSIAVMDLRLLGFARAVPFRVVHQLLKWAWVGFAINVTTGILFIFAQASFYYPNMSIRIKFVLIALAGLNALWFQLKVHNKLQSWPENGMAPPVARVIAGLSLVLWLGVICFGRFIMYWPPY